MPCPQQTPDQPGPGRRRRAPELLAPAGNLTCLQAAIQAGCDAVYFGLGALNMRSSAANFDLADVDRVRSICQAAGVRSYLTLNTMVYQAELNTVKETLARCAGKVDAVICWDPAVIRLCRDHGLPVHVSTQASVANSQAARFYRDLGAERIILARECSLDDMKAIKADSGVEIEVFAHGAMCVSVSGRCFISQFAAGKSANRGECQQHCRRTYRVLSDDGEHEFEVGSNTIFSAKDVCTMPFLERVLGAGVDALKIEGRNRNATYVHTVVSAYRQAIEAWRNNTLSDARKRELTETLQTVYNREFSAGHFLGKPINEFTRSRGSSATQRKDNVGIVTNYYAHPEVAEILIQDHPFRAGDEIIIEGPTTGVLRVPVTEVRQNETPVKRPARGVVTVKVGAKVRVNDRVSRLRAAEFAPDAAHRDGQIVQPS